MTPIMVFLKEIESNYPKKKGFGLGLPYLKNMFLQVIILIGLFFFFLSYLLPFNVESFLGC
jgi:hypothetical protein